MRKQSKSMLVLAIFTAFIAMAVFFPGMTLTVETAEAAPPAGKKKDESPPAPVPKTGQTTSYEMGDDGVLQKGVAWPDPRFTDHEDGTVTDNLTGLMWTKDADIYDMERWEEALSDCADCSEGGYTDWRLPNVRELHSLISYGHYDPAFPYGRTSSFDNVQSSSYWSSTTYAGYPGSVWRVNFHYGLVYLGSKSGSHVWCVRGGQ